MTNTHDYLSSVLPVSTSSTPQASLAIARVVGCDACPQGRDFGRKLNLFLDMDASVRAEVECVLAHGSSPFSGFCGEGSRFPTDHTFRVDTFEDIIYTKQVSLFGKWRLIVLRGVFSHCVRCWNFYLSLYHKQISNLDTSFQPFFSGPSACRRQCTKSPFSTSPTGGPLRASRTKHARPYSITFSQR